MDERRLAAIVLDMTMRERRLRTFGLSNLDKQSLSWRNERHAANRTGVEGLEEAYDALSKQCRCSSAAGQNFDSTPQYEGHQGGGAEVP